MTGEADQTVAHLDGKADSDGFVPCFEKVDTSVFQVRQQFDRLSNPLPRNEVGFELFGSEGRGLRFQLS